MYRNQIIKKPLALLGAVIAAVAVWVVIQRDGRESPQPPSWRDWTAPDQSCRAQMPGEPTEQVTMIEVSGIGSVPLVSWSVELGGGTGRFGVMVLTLPPDAPRLPPAERIAGARDNLLATTGARLQAELDVMAGGLAGREWVTMSDARVMGIYRTFADDRRLWSVMALYRTELWVARRFVDSFVPLADVEPEPAGVAY